MKFLEAKNRLGPPENKARRVRPTPTAADDETATLPSSDPAATSEDTATLPAPPTTTPARGSRKAAGRRTKKGTT